MCNDVNNDQVLLEALRQGNEKAFRTIYEKYWERLFSVAYHWIRSEEDVKELVQDVFTQLWCNKEKIHIRKSFHAYLFTALKYKVFNYLEAQHVRKRHAIQMQQESFPWVTTPEELMYYHETKNMVENTVKLLPLKTRKIFLLSRHYHYSTEEIAQKMHLTPKAIEYHLTNALKYIKYAIKAMMLLFFFSL